MFCLDIREKRRSIRPFFTIFWLCVLFSHIPPGMGYFLGDSKAVLTSCSEYWTLQDHTFLPLLFQMTVCVHVRVITSGSWVAFSYSSPRAPRPDLGLEGDEGALYGWLLGVRHRFPITLSQTQWHRVCLRRDVLGDSFSLEVDGSLVAERTVIAQAIPPAGSLRLGCRSRDLAPGTVIGQVELYMFRVWEDLGDHEPCEDGSVIGWDSRLWGVTSGKARQRDVSLLCGGTVGPGRDFTLDSVDPTTLPTSLPDSVVNALATLLPTLRKQVDMVTASPTTTTTTAPSSNQPTNPPTTSIPPMIALTTRSSVYDPTNPNSTPASTTVTSTLRNNEITQPITASPEATPQPHSSTLPPEASSANLLSTATDPPTPPVSSILPPTTRSANQISASTDTTPPRVSSTLPPTSSSTNNLSATTETPPPPVSSALPPTTGSANQISTSTETTPPSHSSTPTTPTTPTPTTSATNNILATTETTPPPILSTLPPMPSSTNNLSATTETTPPPVLSTLPPTPSSTNNLSTTTETTTPLISSTLPLMPSSTNNILATTENTPPPILSTLPPMPSSTNNLSATTETTPPLISSTLPPMPSSTNNLSATTETTPPLISSTLPPMPSSTNNLSATTETTPPLISSTLPPMPSSTNNILATTETPPPPLSSTLPPTSSLTNNISRSTKTTPLPTSSTLPPTTSSANQITTSQATTFIRTPDSSTTPSALTTTMSTGSPPVQCNLTQLCSNQTAFYWVLIDVEATGANKSEADILNWVAGLFTTQGCGLGSGSANSSVTPGSSTRESLLKCQGNTQGMEVTCDKKRDIRRSNCSVLLQLSQPVSVCSVKAALQSGGAGVQVTVLGEVERVGRGLCMDTAPSNGGFVKCTSSSPLEDVCQTNTHTDLTCSLLDPGSRPEYSYIPPSQSCENNTEKQTCNCSSLCNSKNGLYAFSINITNPNVTASQISTMMSSLQIVPSCNPQRQSLCEGYSLVLRLYQAVHLECQGTNNRLYSCMVLLQFSESVPDICILTAVIKSILTKNNDIVYDRPLMRMVLCGSPGLALEALLKTNLTWGYTPLSYTQTCQSPFLLSCQKGETLAMLLTDSCPGPDPVSPNTSPQPTPTQPNFENATTSTAQGTSISTMDITSLTRANITQALTASANRTTSTNYPFQSNTTGYRSTSTPDNTASTPDNTSFTPGNTTTTPDNTSSTPGNTTTSPDSTGSTPGNTTATRNNTTTTPRNTTLELHSTPFTPDNSTVPKTTPAAGNVILSNTTTPDITTDNSDNTTITPSNTTLHNSTTMPDKATVNYTVTTPGNTTLLEVISTPDNTTLSSTTSKPDITNSTAGNTTVIIGNTTQHNTSTTLHNTTILDSTTSNPDNTTLHLTTTPDNTTHDNTTSTPGNTTITPSNTTLHNSTTMPDKATVNYTVTTPGNTTLLEVISTPDNTTLSSTTSKPDITNSTAGNTTVIIGNTTQHNTSTTLHNTTILDSTTSNPDNTTIHLTTTPDNTTYDNTTSTPGNTTITPSSIILQNTTSTFGNTTQYNITTTPYNIPATPGNTTASPDNTTAILGNITITPGNTTASPGNATIITGNTTASPNNTTANLGNTTITPVDTTPHNTTSMPVNITRYTNVPDNTSIDTTSALFNTTPRHSTFLSTTTASDNTTDKTTTPHSASIYNTTFYPSNATVNYTTGTPGNTIDNGNHTSTTISASDNSSVTTTALTSRNTTTVTTDVSPIFNLNTTANFNSSINTTTVKPSVSPTIYNPVTSTEADISHNTTRLTTAVPIINPNTTRDKEETTRPRNDSEPTRSSTTPMTDITPATTAKPQSTTSKTPPTIVTAPPTTVSTTPTTATATPTSSSAAQEQEADQLSQMTQGQLNSSEVELVVNRLEQLLESPSVSKSVGQKALTVVSNLMAADPAALSASADRLIKAVDTLGLKLDFDGNSGVLLTDSLALAVTRVDGTSFQGASFSISSPTNLQVSAGGRSKRSVAPIGSVSLPSSLTESLSPQQQLLASRVQFTFYQNTSLFQDRKLGKQKVISPVLGSSVANLSISGLRENVSFTLRNKDPPGNYTASCVFWDFTRNDFAGGWNSAGCVLVNISDEDTTCSCNHLTSFAILLDLSQHTGQGVRDKKVELILTFITYIGCGLSAIFLSVTLLTYLSFQKLRRDTPSKILIQLCLSLLLLNLLFLLDGWLALYPATGLCISTAFFLHYFLLTSFTWTGLEALHMYLSIVRVFTPYLSRYMLKLSLLGWGLPAVVVVVVIAVDKNNYGMVTYADQSTDDFCWIRNPTVFYVGVVAYFLVVFVLSVVVFIVVLVQLARVKKQNPQNVSPNRSVVADLRSIAGLIILLGLTWGFALFAWGNLYLPFIFLFTIFNSLQGFFIFVFHCAVKDSVRKQWRTFLCCGRLRLAENSDWSRTATHRVVQQSVTSATNVPLNSASRRSSLTSDATNGSGSVFADSVISETSNRDVILNDIQTQGPPTSSGGTYRTARWM